MDKKLKSLFEFQKFAANPKLNKVIEECEEQASVYLYDDSLAAVVGGKAEEKKRPDGDKKER